MFNAAKALLQTPVPGPRSAASEARRRVVPHLPAVLQTAAAAVAAWYLAVLLLPTERPAFASIAAVICVGITYGKRRWRALELVGGVVLGISISSVLLYLIGTGPLQIALLVILAMTAALLFRGGELLVNEAAISAILLASLQTADAGFSADRIFEGLIGGGVGLVIASLLLPPDPVAMVSRVAQTVDRQARAHARGGRRGAGRRRRRARRAGAAGRARHRRRRRRARGGAAGRERHGALLAEPPRRPRPAAALRAHDAAGRLRRPQHARARPPRAAPRPQPTRPLPRACRRRSASSPRRSGSSACSTSSPSARRACVELALSAAQARRPML